MFFPSLSREHEIGFLTLAEQEYGVKTMTAMNPVNRSTAGVSPSPEKDLSPRTWFFFYLICLVAILWATFLLVREEMVWLSFAMVIVAAGSGMFLFIHNIILRTGFFFYLICLVAVLWATFLLVREEFIWVSMFLVIVSIGISIFVYFMVDTPPVPGTAIDRTPEELPNQDIMGPENQAKPGNREGPR